MIRGSWTVGLAAVIATACTAPGETPEGGPDAGAPEADAGKLVADAAPVDEETDAAPVEEPDAAPVEEPDAAPPEPIETVPVIAGDPDATAIADGHIAVWTDYRGSTADVWGTRLDADGAALDPDGFAVSVAAGSQLRPRIACGSLCLVVWRDTRTGLNAIRAARVTLAGEVLDGGGRIIGSGGGSTQHPDVASDGTGFLVTWEGPCGTAGCGHGILGATVSATGQVGTPTRIAPPMLTASYTPAVAWSGSRYLVAWADARTGAQDLYARRVSADGQPDGAEIAVSTAAGNQIMPAIASDGVSWVMAWQDTRTGIGVRAARVDAGGAVLDADGLAVADDAQWQDAPAVTADADGFQVTWSQRVDGDVLVKVRDLSAGGVLGPPTTALTSSALDDPGRDRKQAQCLGAGSAILWRDAWTTGTTVYAGVPPARTPVSTEPVSP